MTGVSRGSRPKAFYPTAYYNRVGYAESQKTESVVSAKSRTDSLGQRVRERFNEESAYDDKKSVTSLQKLDAKALSSVSRRASNAALSQKSGHFSRKTIPQSEKKSQAFSKRAQSTCAISNKVSVKSICVLPDDIKLDNNVETKDEVTVVNAAEPEQEDEQPAAETVVNQQPEEEAVMPGDSVSA